MAATLTRQELASAFCWEADGNVPPSRAWRWGRLVVVHPSGNTDFADACERCRDLLVDDTTFGSATVEQLLEADVLSEQTTAALPERYLPD